MPKTWTVTHACPLIIGRTEYRGDVAIDGEEPCEADVEIVYEPDYNLLIRISDEHECGCGHPIPLATLDAWLAEDERDHERNAYEDAVSAEYYHRSGGL